MSRLGLFLVLALSCSLAALCEIGLVDERASAQAGSVNVVSAAATQIGELAGVEAELSGLERSVEEASARLKRRTRALYRISRAGVTPLSGGFSALLGHIARVERLERMVSRDLTSIGSLRVRVAALRSQRERLRVSAEAEAANNAQIAAQRQAAAAEQSQLDRVQQIFSPGRPRMSVGRATSFESLRGELALPISAPQAIRVATREADGEGLELDGARGARVLAAASGTVAFAGRHALYGRLVILEHGGGYFSVYGGLAHIDVESGDTLTRAMQLGAVDGEPLFFQVRRGSRALDSRTWLGI